MSLAKEAQKLAFGPPQQQQQQQPQKPSMLGRVGKGLALGAVGLGGAAAIRSGAGKALATGWRRGGGGVEGIKRGLQGAYKTTVHGQGGLKSMGRTVGGWINKAPVIGQAAAMKTSSLEYIKTASEVSESINFGDFWQTEGRGRGPLTVWEGQQTPSGHRFSDQKLARTLEYADAQGMSDGVKAKIRDEHERTSALQAIQATARVQ